MKPEIRAQKVGDLNARIEELEVEKRDLEERRKRLGVPAIDRELLSGLLDNFEEVMAEGTNPQKKDLLRRLVKKVLVHDKRTIEIWYALPNQASVRTPGHLAPHGGRVSNPRPECPSAFGARALHELTHRPGTQKYLALLCIDVLWWHVVTTAVPQWPGAGEERRTRGHPEGPGGSVGDSDRAVPPATG